MVIITSSNQIILYSALTSALLISFGTGRSPWRAAAVFARNLVVNPKYLLLFFSLLAILFCNKLELAVEALLKPPPDFTPFVHRLEGNFVERFQYLFHAAWLTPILAFFYVILFQSLLIASLGIYMYRDRTGRQFTATCYAVMINYLIAIPFYLFVPVTEVWAFNPNVHFYMLEAFPNFEAVYRGMSGLDNCFPSLHTSISVTLALLGLRSGYKRWAWLTGISALIIIFTIFYMGIHWLTDMLGGLCLSTFAVYIGYKLADLRPLAKQAPSIQG